MAVWKGIRATTDQDCFPEDVIGKTAVKTKRGRFEIRMLKQEQCTVCHDGKE